MPPFLMRTKSVIDPRSPHSLHVRSFRGSYAARAEAARHGLHLFFRYRLPLEIVKSSRGFNSPHVAHNRIPDGGRHFKTREGLLPRARAARQALQRRW